MRYYTESDTLFIRGKFRAAITGINGGIRPVPALMIHSFLQGVPPNDPAKELELAGARSGLGPDPAGLLTPIPANHACVLQYDFITVFISAGIRREGPGNGGSIAIVITSTEGLSDGALLEAIMVATEAKTEALQTLGLPLGGTASDGVIAACEGEGQFCSASRDSEPGRRIREAVLHGIPEALSRHDRQTAGESPAFFVYSRFRGEHWVAWSRENCPYYPCHFEGQSCEFCYCPFYPCGDESLGQWTTGSDGKRVWNCARCTLLHEPAVAAYLKRYPGASRGELVRFRSGTENPERQS